MEKVIHIRNLHCANCAREMQEELEELNGVNSAVVDFINQRVTLDYETDEGFNRAIHLISHFEEVKIIDGNAPVKKEKYLKEILSIAFAVTAFLPALILQIMDRNAWVALALYLTAFVCAGWSVVWSVVKNFGKLFKDGFRLSTFLDENTLMLLASVGAFCIGEYMEGAIVMLLYQIGELLQSIAVGSSRNAIAKLTALNPDRAILLEEGKQREVAPERLRVGDTLLIRLGDKVAVDCELLDEVAVLDTKALTGEAYLREVSRGEELLSGTVNAGNAVRAKVLRPLSESAVAKILNVVESASSQKAKPEKFITKFARYYTPIVVLCALLIAFIPPIFYGYTQEAFSRWLISALNFLVISCPCALIISVPLTYFSGIGSLARNGVLSKGAVYLDLLAQTNVVAFDKTGTLTEGKFSISKTHGSERALPLICAVERASSHPLAQAFHNVETELIAENITEVAGMGVVATVDGKSVLVGGERFLRENHIDFSPLQTNASVVYVAENGEYLGCVEIVDNLKGEAKSALDGLKELGVDTLALLTGDKKERALETVKGLPIDVVCADLLPEQKPKHALALKGGGSLVFVGDGINDTPVMAVSDVAISMGSLGSDCAVEASDVVLVSDHLSALPKAIKTAKKTRKIVLQNIIFSIAVKVALMGLSVAGLLPLWVAVFGDVGVMLLAVLNSMRMRGKIK